MTIQEMHTEICNNVVMDKGKQENTLIGIYDLFHSQAIFTEFISKHSFQLLSFMCQPIYVISLVFYFTAIFIYIWVLPRFVRKKENCHQFARKDVWCTYHFYQLSLTLYVFVILEILSKRDAPRYVTSWFGTHTIDW